MAGKNLDKSYIEALKQAKTLILETQQAFLISANRQGMEMRWRLGCLIEENSARYDWGHSVLDKLSEDLNNSFQGNKSFSAKNLRSMRQFYTEYKEHDELAEIAKTVR